MRLIVILIILKVIPAFSQETKKIFINPESSFTLHGSSNVNEFSCSIVTGFCGEELDVCYSNGDKSMTFDNAQFSVPVGEFDCRNKFITRDMQKTLKEDEYPQMSFKLLNIEFYGDKPIADVLITIAGHTNLYHLHYTMNQLAGEAFGVNMSTTFRISDFNIETPTALMGLLKVSETIRVDIDLSLSVID